MKHPRHLYGLSGRGGTWCASLIPEACLALEREGRLFGKLGFERLD